MSPRSVNPRTWWWIAVLFTVTGVLWLVLALLPHRQDPYLWLRLATPIVWFVGAVAAAVRAHRAGAGSAKRD